MDVEPTGRRERKKAATAQKIASTALHLFLTHGYDKVGIRDVATEADVAVTTVFAHFASKEALVFAQDQDFEQRLIRAVSLRLPTDPLLEVLHREVLALLRHCTSEGTEPYWQMINASPALRDYEHSMRMRHADSLATSISADLGLPPGNTTCRTLARFVIDAFSLGREAADPEAAIEEIFRMIEAAWEVGYPSQAVTQAVETIGR